jgi:hypothetical protein
MEAEKVDVISDVMSLLSLVTLPPFHGGTPAPALSSYAAQKQARSPTKDALKEMREVSPET